jgi:hypothetical protein
MMRKLLEAMTKFAGQPAQKPGEQWKGTDKGTPGNKLVGSADESVLKDLSKGQTPKTKEQELAEEWANFNEDDLGVEEKRPHRTGSRADKVGVRGHKEQPRYTTVKDEVDEATAAGLKVGDHVTANTSKGEYPGGHKSRAGKVTRVGQTGVHIRPDDGGEVEYHPYKIVKKTVKDKDVYEDSLDNEYEGGESDNDYFDRQKPKKLSKRSQQRDNAADARKIGSFSVDGKVVRSNVNGLDHKQVAKELSNKYPGKNIEWNMTSKPFNEGWNNGSDRVHLSDSTSAYWGGTGRLQAEYDELYKQLVPASGAAETLEGEVIRASSKIVYRHFNDGDEFNKASFDQLKPFIGSVTSYDDLAEKAIEFALKAQGNYHPNAGWDSLDVMDYGPSEEEEYDDEEDDEDDTNWEEEEDNLEEAGGPPKATLAFAKKADRATALHHFKKGMANDDLSKFTQAQAQIDADRENERDRFSQEELYPADDSHDVEEGKHFKTAYGWAGGRNEKTGKMYKHPDQIKADREAKKAVAKDAFNDMLGGNAADLTRDLKIREAASSDKLVARAHAIIRKHGDADMGHNEFMQLLTANGIPEKVAHQVASDYRPMSEGWGADTQKAESDRSAAAWDTLRAKYANDPAVIKRLNYLERMNWTAAAAEKKANAGEIKGVAESKADTTGSWVVHSGSKVKKFKTRDGAKAYAEKNGGKVASSEFYADKVQKDINEDVTSTDPLEGALLNAIQELVSQGHKDVDPMVLTNMVVAATSRPFLLKDLVDANNNSLAVQHYIDSISPSKVKFSTDTLTVKNEDPSKDKAKSQAGVSSMASRAANRSRLGEGTETPLQNKDDYNAKRAELQRIQLDPSTAQDPQLKAEVIRRLHSLNQQYSTLREQITKFKESRGHKAIATKLGNIDRMQNVQIPSPAERREQLRIAKAKEEVGKKQVKEFAAPGAVPTGTVQTANPTPATPAKPGAPVTPANDPAAKQQAQKVATATSTLKTATGSTVAAPMLAKAIDTASQGKASPTDMKALAPMMGVVDAAAQDPKLASQFKTLATQAQQSLKAQQKPQ